MTFCEDHPPSSPHRSPPQRHRHPCPMAFVSYLVCTRPASARQVPICAAERPHNPREKHPISNPLIDDTNGSRYLRSLCGQTDPAPVTENRQQAAPSSPPPVSSPTDVWDTLIDDRTVVDDMLHPPSQLSSQEPTIDCARARMAARPSNTPKPELNTPLEGPSAPKRKRGRPKGSKSMKTSSTPPPPVSPFMSAVREDLRRRNMAAKRDLVSGNMDAQSGEPVNWDQVQISAPNGLPADDDSNKDLLQELLPILSQQENEENRIITDEEERVKRLIATCYTQFSSIHRSSDRLDNLKPYKLKKDSEEQCEACEGSGMTVCAYCEGQGYVDLGENGEKFNPKFRNNVFTKPRHVMGNIYHCPLCGGLQEERCEHCLGTGTATGGEEVVAGASKEQKDNRAWKVFDMDELMRREADRIEVGLDGTIIMRAKRRGRRKKTTAEDESKKSPVLRRRRGRPPKGIPKDGTAATQLDDGVEAEDVPEDGVDLTPDLQTVTADTSIPGTGDGDKSLVATPGTVVIPRGRPVVRTTDFVNTTDYQVGRRLQRQAPTVGPRFLDPPNLNSSASQEKQDEDDEKRNDGHE